MKKDVYRHFHDEDIACLPIANSVTYRYRETNALYDKVNVRHVQVFSLFLRFF